MQQLTSTGLILFKKENDTTLYLLLHYPHGHWDFVKGKVEHGETKEEAALRELEEETGLTARIIPGFEHSFSYVFTQNGQKIAKTVVFFVAQTEQKEITLSFEHVGYAWLAYPKALERLTFDNAKELLKKAQLFIEKGF